MSKTCLDTFENDFGLFWNFEFFFDFEKFRLDTFGDDFGHFWNFETFLIILRIFEDSTPHGTLAKLFFRKNQLKTCSKLVWTLLRTILGFFGILKFFFDFEKFRLDTFGNDFGHYWIFEKFLIFWNIFDDSTLHGTLGKNFFSKISPQNMFKTRLDTFGDGFGHFWNFENVLIFWKFSKTRPSMEHWAKIFFRKNHPKTSSKHVWTLLGTILGIFGFLNFFLILKNFIWTLLGTILGIFGILKLFWLFWKFLKTRPSMEHWQNFFFEKITSKHVQNLFGYFWERFWAFLEFWNFFWFWKISFGHFWGRFWAFLEFWNFFDFFGNFRRLDPPWNTGEKKLQKNHPKTSSKHVGTLLRTILGIFGILKKFWFFWNFSMTRPSMEHRAKNFFEKNTLKHLQNKFGHFWERFWGIFGILKFFWFFGKFSNTRPSMEHWAKFFFENITPKHLQNTFGHFWEQFWACLGFWIFFDFFENFRRLDPPWNTRQVFIFEKITSKHVQNTFGHFWERFWAFLEFWNFFWLWKISFGHFWGRFWVFLEFWNCFDFFETFRRLDPPRNTGQKVFSKKSP